MSACPVSPSSSSVCAIFDGKPGGWSQFLLHWGVRAGLIAPGLALTGVRGRRLVTASLASSTLISMFLIAYTAVAKKDNPLSTATLGGASFRRRRRIHTRRKQLGNLADWYVEVTNTRGVTGKIRFSTRKAAKEYVDYVVKEKIARRTPRILRA